MWGVVLCSFDAEAAQFLHACLDLVDIRNEVPSYSAVWAIMKVSLLSLVIQLQLRRLMAEAGDGPPTIRHTRCRGSAMAMWNLSQSCRIVHVYRPGVAATLEHHMQDTPNIERRTVFHEYQDHWV